MPSSAPRILRAALATSVLFFLVCAGTPGFSSLGSAPSQGSLKGDWKAKAAAGFLKGSTWINQRLRKPLARRLRPVERVFRIRQAWNLYSGGPNRSRSLEILVDDRLVYRSNDPEHAWLDDKLGHRRVRPINQTLVEKDTALNWKPMMRFVLRHAQADFPEMTSLQLQAQWTNHRGDNRAPVRVHGRRMEAPDWSIVPLDKGAGASAETP